MPTPRKNERRKAFIDRCIPIVIDDGTAEDGSQAAAICNSIWRESKKEVEMTEEVETTGEVGEVDVKEKPNKAEAVVASIIPFDATSFEEVDEFMKAETVRERMAEVTRQFETLTHNIMFADESVDKVKAMNNLVAELDKRLKEAIDLGSTTIWDAMKGIFKSPDPKPEPKTKNGLFIWKDGDLYRWFAVYSNKYRDEDLPPEILSEKSHIKFVEMVDAGLAPYPELLHWHIPGTRWGISDWIAYDEELGFSLASGVVDRGHELEAKAIMEMDEPLAVSHGLEVLERDEKDPTIIEHYVSHEISDLPFEAAANKLTGFSLIEAKEMSMIPDEKKRHLLSVGLTEEKIDEIELDLEGKASKADEAGLDFKETDESQPEESPEVEGTEEAPEAEPTEETEKETEVVDLTEPATRQEVAEALTDVVGPILTTLDEFGEKLEGLSKDDEEKIKEVAEDTPAFSIAHLVRQDLSVVGKDETKVKDDEVDRPLENEVDEKSISGVPWIDSMLVEQKD